MSAATLLVLNSWCKRNLEFAFLRNLVIGLIDGGDLLGGDRDELLRQARRD